MRVACYCRCSTEDQDPGNQLRELRAWAEGQDYRVVGEDVDIASGARRRERLDDLFEGARRHRFDIVAMRERQSELTKAGLARAWAQGKRLGRPPGSTDRRKRRTKRMVRRPMGGHT